MSKKRDSSTSPRDPARLFRGRNLEDLLLESGHRCSHPFCDYPRLTLEAHHIIQHSKGGLTTRPNGLILCSRCHRMVHDNMVPKQLLLFIKGSLQSKTPSLLPVAVVYADVLIGRVHAIRNDKTLQANEKFRLLNDVLIAANFLPTEAARFAVFTLSIGVKVSILNDGISPIRSSLGNMLLSLNARRKWAQVLAANAIWYAEHINDTWLALSFIHSRAVGFNARNSFPIAVAEFRRALDYLDNISLPVERLEEASELRARLVREMAVCRAKITQHSRLAVKEATSSLDMSCATGDPQGIFDGLNRCVEAFLYEGEFSKAELYLGKILSSWSSVSDHSKAIARKMQAKLLIAQNRSSAAEEVIQEGLDLSLSHRFHHQVYHFKRLQWNQKLKDTDPRNRIIT